jgi:hypothetical protein
MNKKGSDAFTLGKETMFMLTTLFLISVGIVVISLYLLNASKTPTMDPLKIEIYSSQLLYNKNCLAYESSSGFVVFGAIDYNKFTNKTLENCMFNENTRKTIPTRISLKGEGIDKEIHTASWIDGTTTDYQLMKNLFLYENGVKKEVNAFIQMII